MISFLFLNSKKYKLKCLIALVSLCSFNGLSQIDCVSNAVSLLSQTDVDNFVTLYSSTGCDTVGGDLYIFGSSINNVSGLSFLKFIQGKLSVQTTSLINLNGFQNLEIIDNGISIENSNLLTSISFPNLESILNGSIAGITDAIHINSNSALLSIDFPSLTYVGEDISIIQNSGLNSLNGLNQIAVLNGSLEITNNSSLSDCCLVTPFLKNQVFINGIITISGNNSGCNSIPEVISNCTLIDSDTDGISDSNDNCISSVNSNQQDSDGDGIGDACDNCIGVSNFSQDDTDGDGIGDACEVNCPGGNISLNSQTAVDTFVNTYKNSCTTINGSLSINGASIVDISGLSFIQNITGSLDIRNTYLTSISSLSNLRDLSNGSLNVESNLFLNSLNGLHNLNSVYGSINIYNNANLQHLNDLFNIVTIGSILQISNNDSVANISLDNLVSCFEININQNGFAGSLTSISGFDSLISCNDIRITNNYDVISINGFNNLESVTGYNYGLTLTDNDQLLSIQGFERLTNVSWFNLTGHDGLININGFNALTTVSGFLDLRNNSALTNLNGLSSLTDVPYMEIDNNDSLIDISALENLTNLTEIDISNNDVLDECCILQTLQEENIVAVTDITISGNNTNCMNLMAVENFCKDSDKDGVADSIDNCDFTVNSDQADNDADGVGDVCDNCPNTSNPSQADSDSDGIGDDCEPLSGNSSGGVGIGTTDPNAILHVSNGDVFIDNNYRGIILKSINGNCYRVKIDDNGRFESKMINCPDD